MAKSRSNSSLNSDYGISWGAGSGSSKSASAPATSSRVSTPSSRSISAGSGLSAARSGGSPTVSTPSGGGRYYNQQTNTYVAGQGMNDKQRTIAAIQYYSDNNMASNLQAALRYAQSKGYGSGLVDDYLGGSGSQSDPTSPYGYVDLNPTTSKDFNRDYSALAKYQGSDLYNFNQAASKAGYSPEQSRAMAEAYAAGGGGFQGQPTDEAAMRELFYQTPEGQQTLQIQKQEEEKMKMQAMLFDDIFANLDSMKAEFAQYGAEGQAALAASYNQMLASIEATEASLTAQIKGQMSADDPQMLAAIGIIKSEAKKLAEGLLEEMNARGVVQSGLYAKAMEDLNSGTMTEIQKMITSRVSDLQNQLNSTLLSMAQSRMSIMNTYQTNYANFLSQQQQGLQSLSVAGLNAQVEAAKTQATLSQQDKTNATNLRIAEMNNATSRYSTDQTTSTQKYGYDLSAQTEKYKADLGMGETTAKIVAEMEMQKLDLANRLQVASIGASGSRSGGNNLNDYLKGQEWKLQQINSMKEVVDSMQKDYTNPNKAIYSGRADAIAAINKMGAYGIYDESALAYARDRINTWNPKSTYVIKHGIIVPNQKARTKVNTPQSYAAIDDYTGYVK